MGPSRTNIRPTWAAVTALAVGAMGAWSSPAAARSVDPNLLDSFSIGEKGGALCQVQATVRDPILSGLYERSWMVLCRDASQPVGYIRKLSGTPAQIAPRIHQGRAVKISCTDETNCRVADSSAAWRQTTVRDGGFSYHAEGFEAYGDALDLALQSLQQRRIAAGTINIATTSVSANDGFARTLAGSIDLDKALAEGYRRNHSGDYAEAAEFFEALARRSGQEQLAAGLDSSEFTLNRALQKSNLGEFAEAERLFAEVDAIPTTDMVQQRLRRNFRAMHALNQRNLDLASSILTQPMPQIILPVQVANGAVTLTPAMAASLNSDAGHASLHHESDVQKLSPTERAQIIDAQAVHLRGTVLRLGGDAAGARDAQLQALADTLSVREGRVSANVRLRSQMLGELALAEEMLGDIPAADARLSAALRELAAEYPETNALASARARYAAFLTRHDKQDQALALYRDVVTMLQQSQRSASSMANIMAPYYRILAERAPQDASAASEFFMASQLQVRPGVADTQAVLARELSAGTGESARLFRQATTLTRDIERSRIEDARLAQLPATGEVEALRASLSKQIDMLSFQQAETLALLSQFPQFRVVASGSLSLAELQKVLRPDEAYLKMLVVGNAVYSMMISPSGAQLWQSGLTAQQLDRDVDMLRETISTTENGSRVTYPYDARLARSLFDRLFGPAADQIVKTPHLIFEPDGGMLRLPINLLITADDGLAEYENRLLDPAADPFDMRGIAWVGRATRPSTAVSALAFRNARNSAPSQASRQYLGLGQNLPVVGELPSTGSRSSYGVTMDAQCRWDVTQWSRPISAAELVQASNVVGASNSMVLTGAAFSDSALRQREDLSDYRIIHFATHGLVTAPIPSCPARPALVTSFGDQDSDGLLTFQEIFDLKIDADLVILSACDTAAEASVMATREAGVTGGGGHAMDGLVRSFIGAGGRSVIASHWPAPDDYDATKRLIGGLFAAPSGKSVADALWATQVDLMDDVQTSHPYYWAGFAIIGDGAQALLRGPNTATPTPAGAGI